MNDSLLTGNPITVNAVIALVLTSSVLAALITSYVTARATVRLTKINYQNEYFKKLLDKRLGAYEEVEGFISQLTSLVHIGNGGQMCNLFLHLGHDHYVKFLIGFGLANDRAFWLSNNLTDLMTEFNVFLINNISNKLVEDGSEDDQLIEFGIINVEAIRKFRKEMQKCLYRDLASLHDIETFVRKRKVDGSLYNIPDP